MYCMPEIKSSYMSVSPVKKSLYPFCISDGDCEKTDAIFDNNEQVNTRIIRRITFATNIVLLFAKVLKNTILVTQ